MNGDRKQRHPIRSAGTIRPPDRECRERQQRAQAAWKSGKCAEWSAGMKPGMQAEPEHVWPVHKSRRWRWRALIEEPARDWRGHRQIKQGAHADRHEDSDPQRTFSPDNQRKQAENSEQFA